MTADIETQQLSRDFDDVRAVDGLTIQVQQGEAFGLLGPNGAGKSTVIRMLTTLLAPSSGNATVCGLDIRRSAAAIRAHIGYVPQLISVDGALTGYENLLLSGRLYGIPRRQCRALVANALDYMGLTDAAQRMARTYSGGMIRRLELAQAIMHQPRVLFLDEPTLGLDPLARRIVWEHISKLRRDYRMTILLTTHYMDEADHVCDTIAILNRGTVVASGSPQALKASVGGPEVSLDDVFTHYTGDVIESGGDFRESSRERRVAKRLS